MNIDFDPLGFTRQTETLLRGLGAQDLIKEFKRRNISTDALHRLTKEDFVQLAEKKVEQKKDKVAKAMKKRLFIGADKNQAENIVSSLCISKKKTFNTKAKPYRIIDKVQILQLGERQLSIIQDFVKYCRMKLRKERINFFVEPDKALSASQILCITAEAALKEVNEAELKLKELEAVIITSKNQKHSYILYSIPFGVLCIATYLLLNRLKIKV